MKKVVVYTTSWCPFCHAARRLLQAKGVDFEEIDVASDVALRADIEARSGRSTVPQVFIDDEPHGGYDDLAELDRNGELDALLGLD